jgi:hypothetical protein
MDTVKKRPRTRLSPQKRIEDMFLTAMERGEVCDEHKAEDLAKLLNGIC